jgi:hypothetical protein
LAAENPGGGPLFTQFVEQVFVAGMDGSPVGAVNEMAPAYVPAVAPVTTIPRLFEYEHPPTVGDVTVPKPTRLPPVMLADVVPDVLHEAVVYDDGGSAVAVTLGVPDDPLPLQAANVTPRTSGSAQSAPKRDLFVCILRGSAVS